jgi:hypothetical protein
VLSVEQVRSSQTRPIQPGFHGAQTEAGRRGLFDRLCQLAADRRPERRSHGTQDMSPAFAFCLSGFARNGAILRISGDRLARQTFLLATGAGKGLCPRAPTPTRRGSEPSGCPPTPPAATRQSGWRHRPRSKMAFTATFPWAGGTRARADRHSLLRISRQTATNAANR